MVWECKLCFKQFDHQSAHSRHVRGNIKSGYKPCTGNKASKMCNSVVAEVKSQLLAGQKEEWKYVGGYEKLYEVSNLGQVRNNWRVVLTPSSDGRGYLKVTLYKEGKHKTYRVHRLVADAFVEKPCYKQNWVDHLNGVKTDNKSVNLRWVTNSQNQMNAKQRDNTKSGVKGVRWNASKQKWYASICVNRKQIAKGYFDNIEDAIAKRKELEELYHGEYTRKTIATDGTPKAETMTLSP
jgi:hypothetical protein